MCLFSQVNYIELFGQSLSFGQIVLLMCLFFSTKAFMCYVFNFFEKKSLHVLMGPCSYKKNECSMVSKFVMISGMVDMTMKNVVKLYWSVKTIEVN